MYLLGNQILLKSVVSKFPILAAILKMAAQNKSAAKDMNLGT